MVTARDDRLRLEDQLTRARERPTPLDALTRPEAAAQQDALPAVRRTRWHVGGGMRARLTTVVTMAGGGQRLQVWGVACLLVGTILTAFW
jgi:hypothetical protein